MSCGRRDCSSKADMHDIVSYLVHLLSAVRVGPTAEQPVEATRQDGRGGVCCALVYTQFSRARSALQVN
jgi:hypothetical protein